MAYATDSDLTARVTDASAIALATRELALADAKKRLSDAVYRARTVQAHVYIAAHLLALWTGLLGGESGPVTSLKAGEIAASFAAPKTTDASDYSRTKWGRMFLEIYNSTSGRPTAIS